MNKIYTITILNLVTIFFLNAQNVSFDWAKSIGGSLLDKGNSILTNPC